MGKIQPQWLNGKKPRVTERNPVRKPAQHGIVGTQYYVGRRPPPPRPLINIPLANEDDDADGEFDIEEDLPLEGENFDSTSATALAEAPPEPQHTAVGSQQIMSPLSTAQDIPVDAEVGQTPIAMDAVSSEVVALKQSDAELVSSSHSSSNPLEEQDQPPAPMMYLDGYASSTGELEGEFQSWLYSEGPIADDGLQTERAVSIAITWARTFDKAR